MFNLKPNSKVNYPVEDALSSCFDKVIVIIETWRIVSRLKHKVQPNIKK